VTAQDPRRLERRCRRTGADADQVAWRDAVDKKFATYQQRKTLYWRTKLSTDRRNSLKLWRSTNKILRRDRDSGCSTSTHTPEDFLCAFDRKVNEVRSSTSGRPPPDITASATTSMTNFRVCTEGDVRRIIMASPSKTCMLDPAPTFLLKEMINPLLPSLTAMVNASLREGYLPTLRSALSSRQC